MPFTDQSTSFSVPSSPWRFLYRCETPVTKHAALLSWIVCLSAQTHTDPPMGSAGDHPASTPPRNMCLHPAAQFLPNLGPPSNLFCIKLECGSSTSQLGPRAWPGSVHLCEKRVWISFILSFQARQAQQQQQQHRSTEGFPHGH